MTTMNRTLNHLPAETIQYCRSYGLEAERRLGELLAETERAKAPNPKPPKDRRSHDGTDDAPTLASLGVSKRESSRAQRLPWFEKEAKERQRLSLGRGKKGVPKMAYLIENAGKSAEKAASECGASPRSVERAKALKESSPQEFDVSSSAVDQRREARAALDEQRRRPRWYPLTAGERLKLEYTPGD